MTRARAWAAVALFAFSILVVLATPMCTADGVRETRPFVDAVREVAPRLSPGTTLLIHPPWRDDVLQALDAAGVVPDGVRATTALAPRHDEDPGRVVIVRDTGAPSVPGVLLARAEDASWLERGGVEVFALRGGGGAAPKSDAKPPPARGQRPAPALSSTLLPGAQVEVQLADGRTVPCAWSLTARKHVCAGLPEWMYVGDVAIAVGGRETPCIWSHPTTNGVLRVKFPHVDLSQGLSFSFALSDGAASNGDAAPVTATVKVNGTTAGTTIAQPLQPGFARASIAKGSADAAVDVEVTTPNDGQRHVCFRFDPGAP